MKRLIAFLLFNLSWGATAATVSYQALNTNQFYGDPTSGVVAIKSGVALTNTVSHQLTVIGTSFLNSFISTNNSASGVLITNVASHSGFLMRTNGYFSIGSVDDPDRDLSFFEMQTNGAIHWQAGSNPSSGAESSFNFYDGYGRGAGFDMEFDAGTSGVLFDGTGDGAMPPFIISGNHTPGFIVAQNDSETNNFGWEDGSIGIDSSKAQMGGTANARGFHVYAEPGGTVYLDGTFNTVTGSLTVRGVITGNGSGVTNTALVKTFSTTNLTITPSANTDGTTNIQVNVKQNGVVSSLTNLGNFTVSGGSFVGNGSGLTNLPYVKTITSSNLTFVPTVNADGSTNAQLNLAQNTTVTTLTNHGNFTVDAGGSFVGNGSGITNATVTYQTNIVNGATNVNNLTKVVVWTIPVAASSPAGTLGNAEIDAQLLLGTTWVTVDECGIAGGATSILATNRQTLVVTVAPGVSFRLTNTISGAGYVAGVDNPVNKTNTFTAFP